MESSIKQWHKFLLFSCVALALLASAVPAQTYIEGAPYALNKFEVPSSGGNMTGIGFYAYSDLDPYEIVLYDSFDISAGLGTQLAYGSGTVSGTGYAEYSFNSPATLAAGTYYLGVFLDGSVHAADFTSPQDDVSFFSWDTYSPGVAWADLHDDYGEYTYAGGGSIVAAPANFLFSPRGTWQTTTDGIRIVDDAGDWSYGNEQNVPIDTLTVDVTATDDGPYDMEIEVTGGMDPITVQGSITNSTSDNWDGLYIQLGYGLGEHFELATDGLSFAGLDSNQFLYADTIAAGNPLPFSFGINMGASNVFTLRRFAVPEPSSLLLLAFSGLAFVAMGRRRR